MVIWDKDKNADNIQKHGVDFETAQYAFIDPKRVIAEDLAHSEKEKRYYCFGKVKGGNRIRIIGAGYWRKGKNIYEKENQIQ